MRDDTIARVRALKLAGTVVLAFAFSASPPSITFTNIAQDAGLDMTIVFGGHDRLTDEEHATRRVNHGPSANVSVLVAAA